MKIIAGIVLFCTVSTAGICQSRVSVNVPLQTYQELLGTSRSESDLDDQLALPGSFPPGLPAPVSNNYYPIARSFYPRYEKLKNDYQGRVADLQRSASSPHSDTLLLYYLHDLVLLRKVLSDSKQSGSGAYDDSTISYLSDEYQVAKKIGYHRFELDAIRRQETAADTRGNFKKGLDLSLARIALYENGLKSSCSSCNTIPKAYISAAKHYIDLKDQPNALAFYIKAADHARLSIDKEYAGQQLADFYLQIKEPQKALETLNKVENDSTVRYLAFVTFREKATALFELKKFDEALAYTGRAMSAEQQYQQKRNGKFSKAVYDSLFASIYLAMNQPYNALKYTTDARVIDKIKNTAEEQKLMQDQALLAAKQRLELEKLKDNEYSQAMEKAKNDALMNELEKTSMKAIADQDRLKQESEISLLNQHLQQQTRTRWILFIALGVFAGLSILLFRNNSMRRKAYMQLNEQSRQLMVQKAELQAAMDNLNSAQEQLIQSEKLASLGELTAGIAHEIQNPLNFVNNFSEVNGELVEEMKEEIKKGNTEAAIAIAGDISENAKKISFHGKRADSIVKGMLLHSRASSGVKEPTDINALADEYLRLSYHGLRAKDKSFNATIRTGFDPEVGKVPVISQDIGRAMLNLFTNAFHALMEKKKHLAETPGAEEFVPTISVRTRRDPHRVVITVRDNGPGIPKRIQDKIFQPFFTTKAAGQGTGLGLSMSYEIITAIHGGELTLTTREGMFTEFMISLPLQETKKETETKTI